MEATKKRRQASGEVVCASERRVSPAFFYLNEKADDAHRLRKARAKRLTMFGLVVARRCGPSTIRSMRLSASGTAIASSSASVATLE